jgi:hypothetical protein
MPPSDASICDFPTSSMGSDTDGSIALI